MRLFEKYKKEIVKKLKEKFGYKNDLSAPKLEKVVINVGVGKMAQNQNFKDKILPEIEKDLSLIVAQKPVRTLAKKSIAGFKLREGQIVGLKVTLRRKRMYDFLEKLIKIVLPRVKDFQGIDLKKIDQSGNLTIGIKEHIVFPEIKPESLKVDFGLEISIVSNVKNREEAIEFYKLLGLPLKNK